MGSNMLFSMQENVFLYKILFSNLGLVETHLSNIYQINTMEMLLKRDKNKLMITGNVMNLEKNFLIVESVNSAQFWPKPM